jgi:uncharacterized protein
MSLHVSFPAQRSGPGRWRAVVPGALVALAIASVFAEPLASIPNPRTRDGTWVTDMPGTLRPDTVARLNATIGNLEQTNGVELAVVVIRSLDGLSVEEAAARLFQLWGIGKKNKDNGLLFLWSTGDRRFRVEVGYGLEGVLPDGLVGAILDADVVPEFKSGRFDEGVLAGVDALVSVVRKEPITVPSPKSGGYESAFSGVRTIALGLFASILAALGSTFGFRRWRRYRRRRCPECQTPMVLLSEAEDDASLEAAGRVEERIGSVDYDVWKCPACSHHFTLRYPKWFSRYEQCPQCHNRTKSSTQEVIEQATTSRSGSARVVEQCAFCSFRRQYVTVLPRIEQSSPSSSGSSSSGSSSFGGGSSGGGGASRGY